MSEEELKARIEELESKMRKMEDIEDIKRLQRAYGYYLEHWMSREIVDLFSDSPDVSLTLNAGTYLGKEKIRAYFESMTKNNPEFLHQMMQLSGIVDVDPDGRTAKGRWYGWGSLAMPVGNGVMDTFMNGIYYGEYIKEDGVWKFLRLQYDFIYSAKPAEGWVPPERRTTEFNISRAESSRLPKADIPRTIQSKYPSGYIFPFHFRHPVTGKETSEGQRNAELKELQK
jgi:hypothetical protein